MTKSELANIEERWVTSVDRIETHYTGCHLDHHACAVATLIAEVKRLDEALGGVAFEAADAVFDGEEERLTINRIADIAEKARLK